MSSSQSMIKRIPAYNGPEHFAFFSYSHEDQDLLLPCFESLHASYRFWYDEGIKSGSEWTEEIGRKICACDVFVVFLSEKALASRFVLDEIHFAYNYAKRILPVLLTPVTFSRSLELMLSRIQYVNWSDIPSQEERLKKLTEGFPASIRLPDAQAASPASASSGDTVPMDPADSTGLPPVQPSPAPSVFSADTTAGYEIIRTLGKGGFGTVDLVRSLQSGAEYVMKHQSWTADDAEHSMLTRAVARNERQNMLLLETKPYIPTLIDYQETAEGYRLIRSLTPGMPLKDIFQIYRDQIDMDLTLALAYHAALIIQDIHTSGLVYGDVKPSNFMLDSFGRLNLIDLGSMSVYRDPNYLRIYTPRYAAPEQKSAKGKSDYRFDVYALGIMMQDMFSGLPDPYDMSFTGIQFPTDSNTRKMADRIIARMTAESPAARYSSMGEVLAALELICPSDGADRILRFARSVDLNEVLPQEGTIPAVSDDQAPMRTGGSPWDEPSHVQPNDITVAFSWNPAFNYNEKTVPSI